MAALRVLSYGVELPESFFKAGVPERSAPPAPHSQRGGALALAGRRTVPTALLRRPSCSPTLGHPLGLETSQVPVETIDHWRTGGIGGSPHPGSDWNALRTNSAEGVRTSSAPHPSTGSDLTGGVRCGGMISGIQQSRSSAAKGDWAGLIQPHVA